MSTQKRQHDVSSHKFVGDFAVVSIIRNKREGWIDPFRFNTMVVISKQGIEVLEGITILYFKLFDIFSVSGSDGQKMEVKLISFPKYIAKVPYFQMSWYDDIIYAISKREVYNKTYGCFKNWNIKNCIAVDLSGEEIPITRAMHKEIYASLQKSVKKYEDYSN